MLATLGGDEAALARVVATLPVADRVTFQIDALAVRAENDAAGAMREALALDGSAAQQLALARLAAVLARRDVSSALSYAALIDDRELKSLYLSGAAAAWAEQDARAALAWLVSAVPSELSAAAAASALGAIALDDPNALLANAAALPPALRPVAQRSAILALADRDVEDAAAAIDVLGSGRNRSDIETAFAERFALHDPDAAIEWVMALDDRRAGLRGVLRGAAAHDYGQAIDIVLTVLRTEEPGYATYVMDSGSGDFASVADRILRSDLPEAQSKLEYLMGFWAQLDAEAAFNWTLANPDRIDAAVRSAVLGYAARDRPALVIASGEQASVAVVGGVAWSDPDLALAMLERYRGEPFYYEGVARIVSALAPSDPSRAAQLIEQVGNSSAIPVSAFAAVATGLAARDPAAAAIWVALLENGAARDVLVSNVTHIYARTDPEAALRWLLDMPESQGRDFGLQALLGTTGAASGAFATRALGAISDDGVREQAAVNTAAALARSDERAARRFMDEHIESPRLRQRAEQLISELRGGTDTDAVSMRRGVLDVPR
jgi:hypothetical protein